MDAAFISERVLPHYADLEGATVRALGTGLINRTYLIEAERARAVLQNVNGVFIPQIHENIRAVTERLAEVGVTTPRLLTTRTGGLCVDIGASGPAAQGGPGISGIWRAMTFVEGTTFDVVASEAQARSAGALVARFHGALTGLSRTFVGMRRGAHDARLHFAKLSEAVAGHADHRHSRVVSVLAQDILSSADDVPALPDLAPRVSHGDLKINNCLFAGSSAPACDEAVCLIDLDTVGPLSLAHEMGNAWRSWCNSSGEDGEEATLDMEIFRASLDGYQGALGRALTVTERQALLVGVEWAALVLAARFAADALNESYFGWDAACFPGRAEHNLTRARGQMSLGRALAGTRGVRAALLGIRA